MATVDTKRTAEGRTNGTLRVAVIVPLVHARGDVVEHLRTWTHDQTLDRDQYQVVVASDGSDSALDRRVQALLAPQDVLACLPGGDDMELYNIAAPRAVAPWLVVTEAHCLADPDCLRALTRALEASPELEAASLVTGGHIRPTPFGDTLARWFEEMVAEWSGTGEWPRLSFFGSAIRRDVYLAIAGEAVAQRYGLFSPMLLSARLDARGARIGRVPEAQVLHIADRHISEHHEHTADFARGECAARADHGAQFCERYFGHAPLWANRVRYRPEVACPVTRALVDATARGLARASRDLGWMARDLLRWVPACAAGARPYVLAERLAFRWNEYAADGVPPARRHWPRFLRAHARRVRLSQLEWIRDHAQAPASTGATVGRWSVEKLDDGALVGTHGLERYGDRWFRWTEPVAHLRVGAPFGAHRLIIDTGELRGPPLDYVSGVYVGGRRLRDDSLREQGGCLVVELADGDRALAQVTILSRPLTSMASPGPDTRRLGLPVFSVELRREA